MQLGACLIYLAYNLNSLLTMFAFKLLEVSTF